MRMKSEITLFHMMKFHSVEIHWYAENLSSSTIWYVSPVGDATTSLLVLLFSRRYCGDTKLLKNHRSTYTFSRVDKSVPIAF